MFAVVFVNLGAINGDACLIIDAPCGLTDVALGITDGVDELTDVDDGLTDGDRLTDADGTGSLTLALADACDCGPL